MKNIYSKKILIGMSLLTNVAFAGYLLSTKSKLLIKPTTETTPASPKKAASVEGANLFKSNQLQSCYNALLKREPKVDEGIVQLHIKLDTNGAINHLELVKNDLQDEVFTQCVLSEIRTQRFPASTGKMGKMISHKFKFYRKDKSQMDFTE